MTQGHGGGAGHQRPPASQNMKIETAELWDKHFGDTPSVGLGDRRVESFFEELSKVCLEEDREKEEEKQDGND